jgi:hypothetical protein
MDYSLPEEEEIKKSLKTYSIKKSLSQAFCLCKRNCRAIHHSTCFWYKFWVNLMFEAGNPGV